MPLVEVSKLKIVVYHSARFEEVALFSRRLEQELAPGTLLTTVCSKSDLDLITVVPDIVLIRQSGESTESSIVKEIATRLKDSAIFVLGDSAAPKDIVKSMADGAHDYIMTPERKLEGLLQKIYQGYVISHKKQHPAITNIALPESDDGFVGRTIDNIRSSVKRIISSAISTIYISGETGTGKEAVADLFRNSLEKGTPFIKVNCGAIAPSLMESEFFGHAKGAFTGATNYKVGLIEQASGGWLFFDEVANLTKEAQAALLRVIENQEVTRVGETLSRPIQVRFLSATNEDIEELVAKGEFRQDLWQRLSEKVIYLSPLAQRRDEIPGIIKAIAQKMLGGPYIVTPEAINVLKEAPWKEGNIRQLRNCLRAMTEYSVDKVLTPQCIPADTLQAIVTLPGNENAGNGLTSQLGPENNLILNWANGGSPSFDDLADQLLIKLIHQRRSDTGRMSLRKLALSMGMVRNTLSNRIRALAKKNLLKDPEILDLIGEPLPSPLPTQN